MNEIDASLHKLFIGNEKCDAATTDKATEEDMIPTCLPYFPDDIKSEYNTHWSKSISRVLIPLNTYHIDIGRNRMHSIDIGLQLVWANVHHWGYMTMVRTKEREEKQPLDLFALLFILNQQKKNDEENISWSISMKV